MTETRTNLSSQPKRVGTACTVCTGCGRCFQDRADMQIISSFLHGGRKSTIADSEANKISDVPCVIACDIGTTTVAMLLRERESGAIIDSFQTVNPQISFGADVVSRIAAGREHSKLHEMSSQIRQVLQMGIDQFRQKGERTDLLLVIAANTTMVHLLMEYSVESLGSAPFTSEHLEEIHTNLWGIPTVILPGISPFVGADIYAGLFAEQMLEKEEIGLLLDLGTNGELAIGNKYGILSTATAAGPAFEGGATAGVWGADMITLTARLLEEGLIDETGLLTDEFFEEGVDIGGVHITQAHIRQLQLAKAAILAGIQILATEYEKRYCQQKDRVGGRLPIKQVYLAGGFGYYLDITSAVRIGLIPRELEAKCIAVGNAALEGAYQYGVRMSAVNKNGVNRQSDILKAKDIQSINLAEQTDFYELYLEGMSLKEVRCKLF